MAQFLGDSVFGTAMKMLAVPQVLIASANTTGVDTGDMTGTGINAYLFFGAGTGSGTVDVKLQESDVVGSGYTDIPGAAFTQLVVANVNTTYELFTQKQTKRFIRAVLTVGGTVSFAVCVAIQGQSRNSGNSTGFATTN